jgi:UDP-glucose 4-epimerase
MKRLRENIVHTVSQLVELVAHGQQLHSALIAKTQADHDTDIATAEAAFAKKENAIREHKIDGIVHTAALKAVGESMEKPDEYFEVNLTATNELIDIAKRNNVKKFIFSSTAAVYGSPDSMDPCKEDGPKAPISPYGDSKYQAESKVTAFINTPGNHGTSLRFFNVVGTAAPELLDNSVENLVPIVLGKLNKGAAPEIFGTDYPTKDGTCIRDYVDVRDIARAHLAAADATHIPRSPTRRCLSRRPARPAPARPQHAGRS